MKPEVQFYCGNTTLRPKSTKSIYVDGTAGNDFRTVVDVELSHWLPNRTDAMYKAGTSTEICFNYLEANPSRDYDLVINNHIDVDGVLSVFVLVYPTLAQQFRSELINAAEIGDFWAWGEGKALKVFQMLSLLFEKCDRAKVSLQEAYERCFSLIIKILRHTNNNTQAEKILKKQWSDNEHGLIFREILDDHLTAYHIPRQAYGGTGRKFLSLPAANEPISNRIGLWPQVRNRLDAEKLQLISIETDHGTHYELMVPGYSWADTKGLWLPPGFQAAESMRDLNRLNCPKLPKLVDLLNKNERGTCRWHLFDGFNFANTLNHREFPVILTTIDPKDEDKQSRLPINFVKDVFRAML
jgi:hypothetical protein